MSRSTFVMDPTCHKARGLKLIRMDVRDVKRNLHPEQYFSNIHCTVKHLLPLP